MQGDTQMTGDTLGPYQLMHMLGRGAMARVWRAWDPNLQRDIKPDSIFLTADGRI